MSSGSYTITIALLDIDAIDVPGPDRHLEHALAEQDAWTAREHAAWWTALLPSFVAGARKARPRTTDATSLAAALLDRAGLGPCALGYDAGTIRRAAGSEGRRRPSRERGYELIHQHEGGDLGTALRRLVGTVWEPDLALPRVWPGGRDEAPADAYFNPMIADWARPGSSSSDVLACAEEVLAQEAGYPRCSLRRVRAPQ